MKKLLLMALLGIFLLFPLVSAVCTVTFDKDSYSPLETISAQMTCSSGNEKSQSYTLNWTNSTGQQIEVDTGTTPTTAEQNFFETFVLPSGYAGIINATLTGTNLEGTNGANITGASSSSLLVTNISFTALPLVGNILGISFIVADESNKKVSNAQCDIHIDDSDGLPIDNAPKETITYGGKGSYSQQITTKNFDEGRQYAVEIRCKCGVTGTDLACVDEDGTEVASSNGETQASFSVGTWLTSETIIGGNSFSTLFEFTICANITNPVNRSRQVVDITYNWRCDSGANTDVDRIVFGNFEEIRGISSNTTQMQCHDFVIPNDEHIEKGANQCFGATDVRALNDVGDLLITYSTTSAQFNISTPAIHPPSTFIRASKNIYYSNISFNDYDVDTKKVHVILRGKLDLGGTPSTSIINYTINYFNGTSIPYSTKFFTHNHPIRFGDNTLYEDAIEIEIAGVNTSKDENFNLTITLENYEERQSNALEGISNKTGTFHLDVDCPSNGLIGNNIDCSITAYVEDSQTVQKEVDFTCYISDGTDKFSSLNFNQMVTRNVLTLKRSFEIPSSFNSGQQYVLQCHADYYNFGSRRDSFFDTFTSVKSLDGSFPFNGGITGGAIGVPGDGEDDDEDKDFFGFPISGVGSYLILFLVVILSIVLTRAAIIAFTNIGILKILGLVKNHHDFHLPKYEKRKFKEIFRFILYIVLIISLFAIIFIGIIFGYLLLRNISESLTSAFTGNLLKDNLFRGMFLTAFIVLIIIILFRMLNLRGEVRFGKEPSFRRHLHDKKLSKMQQKINKMILHDEIKRMKK